MRGRSSPLEQLGSQGRGSVAPLAFSARVLPCAARPRAWGTLVGFRACVSADSARFGPPAEILRAESAPENTPKHPLPVACRAPRAAPARAPKQACSARTVRARARAALFVAAC
eukprot:13755987-Alexandrium_andersonii.AAC.1